MHAGKRTSFDLVSTLLQVYRTYAQDVVSLCTLHTKTAERVTRGLKTEEGAEEAGETTT